MATGRPRAESVRVGFIARPKSSTMMWRSIAARPDRDRLGAPFGPTTARGPDSSGYSTQAKCSSSITPADVRRFCARGAEHEGRQHVTRDDNLGLDVPNGERGRESDAIRELAPRALRHGTVRPERELLMTSEWGKLVGNLYGDRGLPLRRSRASFNEPSTLRMNASTPAARRLPARAVPIRFARHRRVHERDEVDISVVGVTSQLHLVF
jgi:hypothetical protein